jgi:hypothetical protein
MQVTAEFLLTQVLIGVECAGAIRNHSNHSIEVTCEDSATGRFFLSLRHFAV